MHPRRWSVLTVVFSAVISSVGIAGQMQSTKPPAPHPAPELHYEIVRNLLYETRDGIQDKSFGHLNLSPEGPVIVTLETVQEYVRHGPVVQVNESVVFSSGETKVINLSNPGRTNSPMGTCQALMTLQPSGVLEIAPIPVDRQNIAPGPCSLNGVFHVTFRAFILKTAGPHSD